MGNGGSRGRANAGRDAERALPAALDVRNERETVGTTKTRIVSELTHRLQNNQAFQKVVDYLGASTTEEAVDRLLGTWARNNSDDPLLTSLQLAADHVFGAGRDHRINLPQTRTMAAAGTYRATGTGLSVFLRATYAHTQAWLKAQGIHEITLHRGMRWDRGLPGSIAGRTVGDRVTVPLQPLSSFSLFPNMADSFTIHAPHLATISARVPASRIISTGQTGFGAKHEGEMVVLGDEITGTLTSLQTV